MKKVHAIGFEQLFLLHLFVQALLAVLLRSPVAYQHMHRAKRSMFKRLHPINIENRIGKERCHQMEPLALFVRLMYTGLFYFRNTATHLPFKAVTWFNLPDVWRFENAVCLTRVANHWAKRCNFFKSPCVEDTCDGVRCV